MSHLSRTRKLQHPENCSPFPIFPNISHLLYAGLQGASVFRRGLADNDALQIPAVARVLRTALRDTVIVDATFPETEESAALKQCFTQGWLHADKGVSKDQEIAGYFFASLLHRSFDVSLLLSNFAIPGRVLPLLL